MCKIKDIQTPLTLAQLKKEKGSYEKTYLGFHNALDEMLWKDANFVSKIYIEKISGPKLISNIFKSPMTWCISLRLISFDILDAITAKFPTLLCPAEIELLKSDKNRFDKELRDSFVKYIQNMEFFVDEGRKLLQKR